MGSKLGGKLADEIKAAGEKASTAFALLGVAAIAMTVAAVVMYLAARKAGR